MDAKIRASMDEVSRRMVEEAQAASSDRIFCATGFANEHISILHQQMRCANLAWALGYTKKINRGDVVAIVGGSFSGLMLAASIAIAHGAIVYIFDKEKRLLSRFLDKGHRYLSPNLNSRYLGKRFDPAWSSPFFIAPLFRWKPDIASSVAHAWLHEFEEYRRKLPIFSFLGHEVTKRHIKPRSDGITIDLRGTTPHVKPIDVDILIDATGFGEENNPHAIADFSYWESGHRLIYDHLPEPCDVLVSGCGDSGLIEAMHYAISGFRHELVENAWPAGASLDADLDLGLEQAKLDNILRSEEIERYEGRVISEVCWWLDTWFRLENWKNSDWSLRDDGAHGEPIFCAIEKVLEPHLKAAFPGRRLKQLDWAKRESFAIKLPLKVQLEVREAVRPRADAWISEGMAALAGRIPVGKLLRVHKLHERARPGVRVTLNGGTPTPYTRNLSPYNVWLMRVLMSFPNVRYRQGKISKITPDCDGRFRVAFSGCKTRIFDRVVTRYGPASVTEHRRLTTRHSRDPHAGSWLLTAVTYSVRTREKHRMIHPAVDQVKSELKKLKSRQVSRRAEQLHKTTYELGVLLGTVEGTKDHHIYRDPQAWLSERLRNGEATRYSDDSW